MDINILAAKDGLEGKKIEEDSYDFWGNADSGLFLAF